MIIQIVRLVNNCFNLELDCKKAGRTNNRTHHILQVLVDPSSKINKSRTTSHLLLKWLFDLSLLIQVWDQVF